MKKQKKIVINRDNVEEFVRSRNTSNDYSITLQKMYDFYNKLKQLVLQLFYEEDK